jgi:hypothetical protein
MSAIDRSKRLAEIEAVLLRAAAKRELLVCDGEGPGESWRAARSMPSWRCSAGARSSGLPLRVDG